MCVLIPGSSKKGGNIVQNVKLVKVNGAVLSIITSHDSKHIAVGSDQGYVRYQFSFSSFFPLQLSLNVAFHLCRFQ